MGTIGALVPIALGMVDKAGLSLPLVMAACVSGAMFGDNLSMISDTTIAATRTQNVELKDKFRTNFWIAFPAAIVTIVLLVIFGRPETAKAIDEEVSRLVGDAYRRAEALVADHREALGRIAAALLEKETMDGRDVEALLNPPAEEGPQEEPKE